LPQDVIRSNTGNNGETWDLKRVRARPYVPRKVCYSPKIACLFDDVCYALINLAIRVGEDNSFRIIFGKPALEIFHGPFDFFLH